MMATDLTKKVKRLVVKHYAQDAGFFNREGPAREFLLELKTIIKDFK